MKYLQIWLKKARSLVVKQAAGPFYVTMPEHLLIGVLYSDGNQYVPDGLSGSFSSRFYYDGNLYLGCRTLDNDLHQRILCFNGEEFENEVELTGRVGYDDVPSDFRIGNKGILYSVYGENNSCLYYIEKK